MHFYLSKYVLRTHITYITINLRMNKIKTKIITNLINHILYTFQPIIMNKKHQVSNYPPPRPRSLLCYQRSYSVNFPYLGTITMSELWRGLWLRSFRTFGRCWHLDISCTPGNMQHSAKIIILNIPSLFLLQTTYLNIFYLVFFSILEYPSYLSVFFLTNIFVVIN